MGVRKRIRYRFDNWMARGVGAQMLLLALATAGLVLVTAVAVIAFDAVPVNDKGTPDSFGMLAWKSLMRALDAGTLAGDVAGWAWLFVMLFVTLGGIFVLSALIGIINQGFGAMIDRLRRGHSAVIESGHTVILGWGPKIFTLLRELGEANANQRRAAIVILADRDKIEMDATIARELGRHRTRIVTRRGNTMSPDDLHLVAPAAAKSIIVLAPEHDDAGAPLAAHESDTVVLKSLLALVKAAPDEAAKDALHIVAELFDEQSASVARMVVGDSAALILAAPLISRLLVQTGRQPGLSIVYTELLDFEGAEIYLQPQPALIGKTFRDAVFAHDSSTVIGVCTADNQLVMAPAAERPIVKGDQLIAISRDDDTVVLDGVVDGRPAPAIDEAAIVDAAHRPPQAPEHTLVLGASKRLPRVLTELDAYVAPGSTTLVVGELAPPAELAGELRNMQLTARVGDVTQRAMLDTLELTRFDHVLLLSETTGRTQEMADARTTVTLLHLRDLERIAGKKVPITSEILDIQNRELASVAEADDFIVSNTLVSLMVAQVAENRHLVEVFDELFTAGGCELYLKPATSYVTAGERAFGLVCEAALRRGEIAIGYRLAAKARDAAAGFGVVVNPSKRAVVKLAAGDSVIVIAES